MLDIVILIIVGVFLLKKLHNILGEEHDIVAFGAKKTKEGAENIKNILNATILNDKLATEAQNPCLGYDYLDDTSKQNVTAIAKVITGFTLQKFADIAIVVVENVIDAYNNKDLQRLAKLLDPTLFTAFKEDMHKKEVHNIQLISISLDKIVAVTKNKSVYTIKLCFDIEQIILSKDNFNKSGTNKIKEIWTFAKDIKNQNNTWFVSNIES